MKKNTGEGGECCRGFAAAELLALEPLPLPAEAAPAVVSNAVKIGVMLPLHDVDGDGKRMVEYYRGLLMACNYLKKKGISTDVHAWNVPIDADIRTTLLQEGANTVRHHLRSALYQAGGSACQASARPMASSS